MNFSSFLSNENGRTGDKAKKKNKYKMKVPVNYFNTYHSLLNSKVAIRDKNVNRIQHEKHQSELEKRGKMKNHSHK